MKIDIVINKREFINLIVQGSFRGKTVVPGDSIPGHLPSPEQLSSASPWESVMSFEEP